MDIKDNEKKTLTLEQQYELDKERRLNNTIEILKQLAEDNMEGKERQSFLDMLPESKPVQEVELPEGEDLTSGTPEM